MSVIPGLTRNPAILALLVHFNVTGYRLEFTRYRDTGPV
jgi:hypothetical protein